MECIVSACCTISHLPSCRCNHLHLHESETTARDCVFAADYVGVVGRVSRGFQQGLVSASSLVYIGVGYMALVVLAVLTNSLALHLPLIYYKQRRSKVYPCLCLTVFIVKEL